MKRFTDIDYTKDIESFQGNTIFEDVYISGTLFYNLINQKEFYPPKLTTTERDTLSLTEGAMIYNSTNQRMEIYNGTEWTTIASNTAGVTDNQLLQITQKVDNTVKTLPGTGNSGQDWETTEFSHSITPKGRGSKIKIWVSSSMYQDLNDATGGLSIRRKIGTGTITFSSPATGSDSTDLSTAPYGLHPFYCNGLSSPVDLQHPVKMQFIDEPPYSFGQTIKYEVFYRSDKAQNKWNGTRPGSAVCILEEIST